MSATLSQAYLFCYNSIQFVLWVRIFVALISVPYPAFSHLNEVTEMVSFCQKFCFLETLHPIVGLVKGGWFTPFSQFVGRNAVLFGFIIPLNQSNKVSQFCCICIPICIPICMFSLPTSRFFNPTHPPTNPFALASGCIFCTLPGH